MLLNIAHLPTLCHAGIGWVKSLGFSIVDHTPKFYPIANTKKKPPNFDEIISAGALPATDDDFRVAAIVHALMGEVDEHHGFHVEIHDASRRHVGLVKAVVLVFVGLRFRRVRLLPFNDFGWLYYLRCLRLWRAGRHNEHEGSGKQKFSLDFHVEAVLGESEKNRCVRTRARGNLDSWLDTADFDGLEAAVNAIHFAAHSAIH